MRKLLLSIILSITVALQISAAGTFNVYTINDNGSESLREAMQNAITNGGGTVSIQVSGTITLTSALPVITVPITITCINPSIITTISGNNAFRVFEVNLPIGTTIFKNLNIINGVGNGGGGGIFATTSGAGKIVLENCTISGCSATGSQAYGGAICSSADVDLRNCTLTGNTAADGGGAVEMIDGAGASILTINHSTITQNSTPAVNIAGGVDVFLGKIVISNSIVGNNTNGNASSARDISLDMCGIPSSSYNLYTTAPFAAPGAGDLINKSVAELGLSPLANNGGGVKTMALTPLSLARNSGTGALGTDARGLPRDATPDRGAYEVQVPTDIALSASAINENVAANSTVGVLSSTDNDTNDTFIYTLVAGTGSTDNASFNIAGNSLRITNSPDFETNNSYTVRVRTTDQNGFFFEKAFTITINNVNETPTGIALSANAINENVAANSTVGTLSSTDVDAGSTFTYALVSGGGSTDNAAFNISGNSLCITNSPDFETKNSYAVRVKTTDQGGLYFEKAFTITINNLPEVVISSITPPADGIYTLGQKLDFTVTFIALVNVANGTPYIPLTIGGVTKHATYVSGSGSNILTFSYTLNAGDAGVLATGTAITLNGATIKEGVGYDAALTFTAPTTTGITIDAMAPTINSFNPPIAGTYIYGQNMNFNVNFSEPVNVDITNGAPYMLLTIGSKPVHAEYQSGSGTTTLHFNYPIALNDYDADGIALTLGVTLNGGLIKDIAGNPASIIAGPSIVVNGVNVDAAEPTVVVPSSSTYIANQNLDFTVSFSKNVTVVTTGGTPYLSLIIGGVEKHATYVTGSGTVALKFRYTVVSGDNGNLTTASSLVLNSGTIKDNLGNPAILTFATPTTAGITVDAVAPTISLVSSTSPNGVYKLGNIIPITLTFDENVIVTGTPTLSLNNGGTANYSSGSGTSTLAFNYTVGIGESAPDLDYSSTAALALGGGTVEDKAGNAAVLTLPTLGGVNSLGGNKDILIGIVPTITTQLASAILGTTAIGNGNITNLGFPNPTAYGMCWNTSGASTTSDSKVDNGPTSNIGAFTASITGLTANTTYYVRAYASNSAGTSYGTEVTFTTLAVAPTTTSLVATSITNTTATLNGMVNANNASTTVTFEYGITSSYGTTITATPNIVTGTSGASASGSITSLMPASIYHYRVIGVNAGGTTYGEDMQFTTSKVNQTISGFNSLPTKNYGDATFMLAATSSSSLAVSYVSDNTGVATVSGNIVTIVGVGTANITASQIGNATYAAATNITLSLTVNKKSLSVTAVADTKTYNGTAVSIAGPTVGVLAAGDEIAIAPTQAFDNASVGTTHLLTASGLIIKKGSADVTANYNISYVPANGSITAEPLTITAPTVMLNKIYDGNKGAAVIAGILSGILAGDAGNVTVTAVASYDNANIGPNKTITVVYTLGGSAAGNYSAPADFVVTGAEISSGTITLEPLSNPTPNAANTGFVLSYSVVTGLPTQYKLTYEAPALAAGIQNVSYIALATTGIDGSIAITLAKGTKPGKYKGTLQMRNEYGVESPAYTFVITVNIPTEYIAVKYNRVLVLDNSTKQFSAYQWYKDGVAIEGAIKQFYRDPKGLVGTYSVQATTTDAEVLYSFPKVLNIPLTQKVTAYPTMVKASQACTVEITDEAMELDLTGAELSVYSTQGICVYHSTKVERLNTIKLPTVDGMYSGRVTTADGQSFLFKVIVAN